MRTIIPMGGKCSYDFVCVEPIGVCRTSELITVKEGFIGDVELFFDARPVEKFAGMKAAQKYAPASLPGGHQH